MKNIDIILIGAPTSGKSLISSNLKLNNKPFLNVSIGDICRNIISEKETDRKFYKEIISGNNLQKLLSIDVVIEIINDYIENNRKYNKFILLDGFPRTEEQLSYLENIKFFNKKFLFILMDLNDTEILERFKKRFENNRRESDGNLKKQQRRLLLHENKTRPLIKKIINNPNLSHILLDPTKKKEEFINDFEIKLNEFISKFNGQRKRSQIL